MLLSDIPEDVAVTASLQVSSAEARTIDNVFGRNCTTHDEEAHPCWQPMPREADEVASVLASVSPTLDDRTLHERLAAKAYLGKFKESIGSSNAMGDEHLIETVDEDESVTQALDDDDNMSVSDSPEDEDQWMDDLCENVAKGEIDLDEIMVSASHAGKPKGVDPAHLSKTWKIDLKTAEKTLEVVSQTNQRTDNPKLSRNYGTNDRMLQHKRINEHFFMDTFFANSKADKSS
jgi:hypothetical protein